LASSIKLSEDDSAWMAGDQKSLFVVKKGAFVSPGQLQVVLMTGAHLIGGLMSQIAKFEQMEDFRKGRVQISWIEVEVWSHECVFAVRFSRPVVACAVSHWLNTDGAVEKLFERASEEGEHIVLQFARKHYASFWQGETLKQFQEDQWRFEEETAGGTDTASR
jgi:hypothetical protein